MKATGKPGLLAVLLGLAALAASASARAANDPVPSFKTSTDKETKEFVTKVGTAIVKAARSKPKDIEIDRYEYTRPKAGRRQLLIKMTYFGSISRPFKKKPFTATITLKIDSEDRNRWEVLDIEYKDDNKVSLASPSAAKVRKLIPQFNM